MDNNVITTKIKEMIVKRLNLAIDPMSIKHDAVLFGEDEGSLGLDSVDSLELAVGLNNEFNVQVTEDNMEIFHSVKTIVDFLQASQISDKQ